jgi:hypothetical protein
MKERLLEADPHRCASKEYRNSDNKLEPMAPGDCKPPLVTRAAARKRNQKKEVKGPRRPRAASG